MFISKSSNGTRYVQLNAGKRRRGRNFQKGWWAMAWAERLPLPSLAGHPHACDAGPCAPRSGPTGARIASWSLHWTGGNKGSQNTPRVLGARGLGVREAERRGRGVGGRRADTAVPRQQEGTGPSENQGRWTAGVEAAGVAGPGPSRLGLAGRGKAPPTSPVVSPAAELGPGARGHAGTTPEAMAARWLWGETHRFW